MLYRQLNGDVGNRDINHDNIRKLLKDLDRYPDVFEDMIEDIFFGQVSIKDVNFGDLCTSLYEMIGEQEQYRNLIKKIVKRYQIKKRENGEVLFTGTKHYPRVKFYKHDIKSWFIPLPIYLFTKTLNVVASVYMRIIGYTYCYTKTGIRIWYNKYSPKNGVPLLFFHGSVGGIAIYSPIFGILCKHYNVIIPELPGISFLDVIERPLNVSEIIEDVRTFMIQQYNDNNEYYVHKLKLNLMGHSLGSVICSAYINSHPEDVASFFLY